SRMGLNLRGIVSQGCTSAGEVWRVLAQDALATAGGDTGTRTASHFTSKALSPSAPQLLKTTAAVLTYLRSLVVSEFSANCEELLKQISGFLSPITTLIVLVAVASFRRKAQIRIWRPFGRRLFGDHFPAVV